MDRSSNQPYQQSAAIGIIVLNVISMCSLLFVLGVYVYNWKKIASFPMRLSFYLCLACLGQNLYVIMLNPITIHNIQTSNLQKTSGYCIFQGILKATFDLSSILWTTLIIYAVYASVVLKHNLQAKECLFLILAFLVPFVLACLGLYRPAVIQITGVQLYGYQGYFCWFQTINQDGGLQFWLKMGYFFIPLWALFFVNLGLSIKTYLQLKRIQLQPRLLTIFKRLMLFPFIMFITGIFATIDLIQVYVTKSYILWLDIAGLMFLSLYGFFNSVAYGFNPLIREKIQVCVKGAQPVDSSDPTDSDDNSSRNTEKIQAELYDIRSNRKPTEPILKFEK